MTRAVRLMFEYRAGEYQALAPQHVEVAVPRMPTTRGLERSAGRFVELRSVEGNAVRAVRVGEAGPPTVEFPTGDSIRPFGRAEPPPGAVLSVLVEAHDEATHAALVDVAETGTRGSTELVRHDLAVVALGEKGQ